MIKVALIAICTIIVLINKSSQTTPNIKETIIQRCRDFQQTQAEARDPLLHVKDVDCNKVWDEFEKAVSGKDPCSINQETYNDLFLILHNNAIIPNKIMLWSDTYQFTKKLAAVNDNYIVIANTFGGFIFDELEWCPKKGDGFDSKKCTVCDPSRPFWQKASELFANMAKGTATLTLNSRRPEPYHLKSIFAEIELPALKKKKAITQLSLYLLHDFNDPKQSNCKTKNVKKLIQDALPEIKMDCTENPDIFISLLCAANPSHEECSGYKTGGRGKRRMINTHPSKK